MGKIFNHYLYCETLKRGVTLKWNFQSIMNDWRYVSAWSPTTLSYTLLYCTVQYCTALSCTALFCVVLYSIVLYCAGLYCMHCTELFYVLLCFIVLCWIVLCDIVPCCTMLYCSRVVWSRAVFVVARQMFSCGAVISSALLQPPSTKQSLTADTWGPWCLCRCYIHTSSRSRQISQALSLRSV